MRKEKTKFTAIFLSIVMAVSLMPAMTGIQEVEAAGTVADAVAIAASQVGYHEKASNYNLDDFTANSGSSNYNKYARDIGVANGQPWCTTFLLWCMKKAGVSSNSYPYTTWVPTMRDWFDQRGMFRARGSYTPKAGDFVIFGSGASHVGIVEYVSGSYVHTIEGNTSSDNVKRNTYSLYNTYILGYGIINYSGSNSSGITVTDTSNPGSPYPIPTGNLRSGSRGDSVKWIQKFANDMMGAGISVDGIYGNQTISAVKSFQRQNGLAADGITGSQTTAKMLSVWRSKIAAATPKPVDLGNEFCAIILRNDIWKPIKNTGSNIVLWEEKATADYYWLFKRQGDGSYTIQSLYDGQVLDAEHISTVSGTNVIPHKADGGDNQKWYIYGSLNAYKIVPKYAGNLALDVAYAGSGNGTNIQIHDANDSVAQKFAIYKVGYNALSGINIISGYDKTMYKGTNQTLKYTISPSTAQSNMVTWSSSDTSVVTVDSSGVVIAKGTGKATIKCTSTYNKSISTSVQITVKEKEKPTKEATTEPAANITTEVTTERPVETATENTTETATETTTEMAAEVATEAATEALTETTESVDETSSEAVQEVLVHNPTENGNRDSEEESEDWEGTEKSDEAENLENQKTRLPEETGTILADPVNKCDVEVISDSIESPAVAYLEMANIKAEKIKIPASVRINGVTYKVTKIADYAFADNTKLTSVTISNTVTEIGDSAFENCKKLKSVIIPKSVKSIGKNAFRNCKRLKRITIKSSVLTKIGKNAFKNTDKRATIQVPKSKKASYKKMLKKAGCK